MITDPDPDNLKVLETQKLWTAFLITFKVPLVCYLHKTGMFADTQHLLLILFSIHPRWGEDFSVGLNICLSFYKKVKLKSGLCHGKGPEHQNLAPNPLDRMWVHHRVTPRIKFPGIQSTSFPGSSATQERGWYTIRSTTVSEKSDVRVKCGINISIWATLHLLLPYPNSNTNLLTYYNKLG